ncbi:hypothetical protein E4U39_000637 [Claviceps sp. Clav50 group G5]|nr:hypothetical protein E4U39_000637 [Claviceps sp. Clav50 group G5]
MPFQGRQSTPPSVELVAETGQKAVVILVVQGPLEIIEVLRCGVRHCHGHGHAGDSLFPGEKYILNDFIQRFIQGLADRSFMQKAINQNVQSTIIRRRTTYSRPDSPQVAQQPNGPGVV